MERARTENNKKLVADCYTLDSILSVTEGRIKVEITPHGDYLRDTRTGKYVSSKEVGEV